jgi:hypothetical protein
MEGLEGLSFLSSPSLFLLHYLRVSPCVPGQTKVLSGGDARRWLRRGAGFPHYTVGLDVAVVPLWSLGVGYKISTAGFGTYWVSFSSPTSFGGRSYCVWQG